MNNIRIIFTEKADIALENLIKKYNLDETIEEDIQKNKNNIPSNIVLIDSLTKDFVKGDIKDKDFIEKLKTNMAISQQIAEQIYQEIINNIVPFINKVSEDNKSSNSVDGLSRDLLDKNRNEDIFPNIKPTIDIPEIKIRDAIVSTAPQKKERIKKAIPTGEIKNIQPRPSRPSGPDNYREPIE